MKKIILTFTLGFFAFYSQAQITITRSDIANSPSKIRYSLDENYAPAVIENKGTGQTWDFKNLQADAEVVTIFDNPSNYPPENANFPTANLALVLDSSDNFVYFIEDSNDSMVVIGTNDDFSEGVRFRQLIFPISYNTKWVDVGKLTNQEAGPVGSGFDSIRFDATYTFTNHAEAEGKLQLQGGSIDVIKVSTFIETNGVIEVQVAGMWTPLDATNFTDSSYAFYAKNNGYSVLSLTKNENGTYETQFKNDIVGLASINKIKQLENAVRIYPNPTTNYLNIESSKADSYIITDILGKNIMNGNALSTIDVSNLAKGNYIIQLFQNEELISVNKFIKD